ncbi:uncharacterized protein LOC122557884 isoform X2 [Chiloscyllium plagiosum]|uniref:uncharacterized protein LOC122557884 isoform X2 n=1 Tax=Chiloscyllium plagiosum TaxID=36176 RepID=UPI001CB821D1|nr:uncharacterized protein LOC122557884 isoform X2 [Chiloscyllium plagiosum]
MESSPGNVDSVDPLSRTGEERENKETEKPAEEKDARPIEAKDYTLFETLCDTVLSSLALLQNSITELLDFKDQLMNHALPTSLLAHLVIITGRLFRSVSDMYTPTTELVRLVRFYATPWEQKKEILNLLYADHERKKHQLDVAVRRLQLLDGHARWIARERQILNWEKLFGKLMTAKTHGRRWKFRVEYLKRKGVISLESQQFMESSIKSEMRNGQIDSELNIVSKVTESRQSLISSEDQEADTGKGNDNEEEKTDDSDLEETNAPMERFPLEGESTFLKIDTIDRETQTEGQTEEQGTWTGDPLQHRFLCVTVSKFYGPFEQGLSCQVTYQQECHQIQLIQDPENKQNRKSRKQVKISTDKQDLPATGSTLGILKTSEVTKSDFAKSALESVLTGTCGAKFEMVLSGDKEDSSMLKVLLFRKQQGVIAEGEIKLPEDLQMGQKHRSNIEIQLFTPKSSRLVARTIAALCISLHLEEMEEFMWKDQSTEAWSLEELVLDATGIDLKETSQVELENCVKKPELRECCTSAMSWVSSSHEKSGLVPEEEVQLLIEEHNLQLAQLQEMHEKQLWNLLESLRSNTTTNSVLHQTSISDMPERLLRSENAQLTTESQHNGTETKDRWIFNRSARDPRSSLVSPKSPQKSAAKKQQKMSVTESLLLKRKLPQDVWERMKVLEENMWRNKQNMIEKLQCETRQNLEKQLLVQKRLHRHSDNRESGNRSKDEICFPALFMPMKIGQVFTPKARLYFHPSGSAGFFRLTQAPSVISLPTLCSSTRVSVLNLLNPKVTLPISPAIEGNHTSTENEMMVNKLVSGASTINQAWTDSEGKPQD